MNDRTAEYYENNASELSQRYESVALDAFHRALLAHIPVGARIIEIGCGSGRDAARAFAEGYDIIALDGSINLLGEAGKIHPEISERLLHCRLPDRLPFFDHSFDGFISIACLMHFSPAEITQVLSELARIVKTGGTGLVSLPAGRADINSEGLDQHGRVFTLMTIEEWQTTFNKCGFRAVAGSDEPDSLGREGITWVTFILTRE